jgi:ribosomal protein S18 acetylase RimI-like enzyme
MTNLLDNPVWHALAALPDHLAIRTAHAMRFVPEVAPFFAVDRRSPEAYADAGALLGASPEARFFFADDAPPPAGWRETFKRPITQMVLPPDADLPPHPEDIRVLGPEDALAVRDLVARAKPGPFGARTQELGTYLGIWDGPRLVAMAGERFRFPGYTEISAVATDPEFRGRGHGRTLSVAIAAHIRATGRTPFMHVFPENDSASRLYRSIGFVPRRELLVVWLAPEGRAA